MKIYIVPVSGGKDSQALAALALGWHPRRQLRFVHQNTGYDHPLTYEHLRYMEKRYRIRIEHTHSEKYEDIFDLIRKQRYFPNNVARVCTSRLKQLPFAQWLRDNNFHKAGAAHIYLGMRAQESADRGAKYGALATDDSFTLNELSPRVYGKDMSLVTVTLPIVQWTEEQVFAYLAERKDKVNPLYAKGHSRVGCYPCLLARNSEWQKAASDPIGREHIKKLLDIEEQFKAEGNPRKLIKIHETRNVRALYEKGEKCAPSDDEECGWCSI